MNIDDKVLRAVERGINSAIDRDIPSCLDLLPLVENNLYNLVFNVAWGTVETNSFAATSRSTYGALQDLWLHL